MFKALSRFLAPPEDGPLQQGVIDRVACNPRGDDSSEFLMLLRGHNSPLVVKTYFSAVRAHLVLAAAGDHVQFRVSKTHGVNSFVNLSLQARLG